MEFAGKQMHMHIYKHTYIVQIKHSNEGSGLNE